MMRRDRRLKRATLDDFANYLTEVKRWLNQPENQGRRAFRGFNNCVKALRLMRENTDSSQETRTRIALMRYGLPCPEVNVPLCDSKTARSVLLDMAYPQLRIAIEYDGSYHASQWLSDISRQETIEALGWEYIRVTKLNLGSADNEAELARKVAHRVAQRLGRKVELTERKTMQQICDGRSDAAHVWRCA